jgi:ABC-type antimicrobial peptide transport system permease subunit/class 3 adenylate cyclase
MRSMNSLVWKNLAAHPLRGILTALAITLGVAMVLAASIVGQAASQSASELSEKGPRIDLKVFSRDGVPFDDAVLGTLRASPDVDRASPSLRVEVEGIDPEIPALALLGVEPESYIDLFQPEVANGAFLDQPDTIVLPMMIAIDKGLNVGEQVTLKSGRHEARLTVAGRLKLEQDVAALDEANVAYVPLAVAQLLRQGSGQALNGTPGPIDQVAVALRPGANLDQVKTDLAAQLGDELVVVPAVDTPSNTFAVLVVQVGLAMVGLIILFAAAFVIMNAFAISVTARTREIGALRALGMTRRQVMYTVLAEAGLLGLVGASGGAPVGIGLAWSVMRVRGTLDNVPLAVPWWGIAASVTIGLAVTLVGALQPTRRASRVSPLTALRTASTQEVSGWYVRHGGRAGGILFLILLPALTVAAFVFQPDFFGAFAFLGVGMAGVLLGAVLLMPALVQPAARLAGPVLARWLGTTGRLAADNLTRNKLRTVLTAGALTVGLTTIIATSALLTVSLKGGLNAFFGLFHEDGMVIPDIPALLTSGELSIENSMDVVNAELDPALVKAVTELDVGMLVTYGFAPVPAELSTMLGAPGVFVDPEIFLPLGNFDFFEGDADSALEMMQQGRAILLMPITAGRLGVGVSDVVLVQTPHGAVEFAVAGIGGTSTNFTVFSFADGETYFDLLGPSWLGIVAPEEQDVETVLKQVREAIAPFKDVVVFDMRDSGVGGLVKVVDQLQTMLNALLLLAVVVAGLGVVNTVVINVAERRREIALLRAVGATQRQIRQSVVAEAATLGLIAALVATVLGLIMLMLYVVIFMPNGPTSVGVRVNWETVGTLLLPALRDLGIAAVLSLIFGPLVAALAAYYPARQAAAMDVVEATRSERVTLKRTETKRPEGHRRPLTRSLTRTMAWRNLEAHRTRTVLSAIAVALGVAMIVATGVIQSGMRSAWESGENKMAFIMDMGSVVLNGVGVITLAAAGFLIFNAFAMTVTQQRRQIGMLRSLGMTRRQVLRQVLAEAACTGGLGTLGGLLAGPLLGRGILAAIRLMGAQVGPGSVAWGGVVLAAAMGMGITLLSALLPARRAARVSPLTALRERAAFGVAGTKTASARPWIGWGIIAVMTIYLIIAPPGQWSGRNPPWDWIMVLSLWGAWLTGLLLVIPALLAGAIRTLRGPLCRLAGTVGRLVSDNLERAPDRTTLTALTFAVGLMMMVGTAGFVSFGNDVLVGRLAVNALQQTAWYIYPFNRVSGLGQLGAFDLNAPGIDEAVLEDVQRLAEGRAVVDESYLVVVPEISSPMPGFPSFVMRDIDRLARPGNYHLVKGDWETALPLLKEGCGLLITPAVAGRHAASVGDPLTVTGLDGSVTCTVAGIGAGGFAPMAVIGPGGKDAFVAAGKPPDSLSVRPLPGTDVAALEADLYALNEQYGDKAFIGKPEDELEAIVGTSDQLMLVFNGMVLLAVIAAALGTINTTLMSVSERRRELGLLRAVGATRRQIMLTLMGETALTGLLGTLLGAIAGVGLSSIFALAYGGITFGLVDLPIWQAAGETVLPALRSGWLGLAMAPLLAAGAAFPAVRNVLRGSAIGTMEPARQPSVHLRSTPRPSLLGQGSLRARFVLGTGVLMAVVLVGLIAVVTTHARARIEEQTHDALRTMVTWNAGLIELGLPDAAERLDFDLLHTGLMFDLDADALLRFESLVDDMTANGLVDFIVVDRDNVVLIGLDAREIGTLVPELETAGEAGVYSERDGGEWLMHAFAPVRNDAGLVVGSVRLAVSARQIQDFMGELRNTLAAIGAAIIFVGMGISWWLATPLTRVARQLIARAAGARHGETALFNHLARRTPVAKTSLRARLTIAMALILVLMVGVLELVTLPIERRHVEDRLKDGLVAAAEWIGQVASESFDIELSDLPIDRIPTFEQMLDMTETLDLARLQELTDGLRGDDAAYAALIDEGGTIVLADQLALIGEKAPVPFDTEVEEATWRDEQVWVVSTPLRHGRDGEQIGGLRMAVRRARVETFLDESRSLFRLTGLIAVLAGVLLAQAIGGAVAAPVRQLAAGTRRAAEGDLTLQLPVDTRDELSLLADAYNQMVIGLQEREWLRDMFGRFVSHEVAEAIRTGKVRLEGENRMVSVLFCDIRGFTARSERCTPEEMVALLNEYLPLVVEAAQRHEGTVNKFGGDSTLVIYGAPRPLEDSAYQAVLTALEMRASLKALNARLSERGEVPIRIGVGINTGLALAGAVGPKERQEYTVIGDTVNLASRIEALNKEYPDYDVLISGRTHDALGRRRAEFEFVDLGEVQIQGKTEPVRVWAVAKRARHNN